MLDLVAVHWQAPFIDTSDVSRVVANPMAPMAAYVGRSALLAHVLVAMKLLDPKASLETLRSTSGADCGTELRFSADAHPKIADLLRLEAEMRGWGAPADPLSMRGRLQAILRHQRLREAICRDLRRELQAVLLEQIDPEPAVPPSKLRAMIAAPPAKPRQTLAHPMLRPDHHHAEVLLNEIREKAKTLLEHVLAEGFEVPMPGKPLGFRDSLRQIVEHAGRAAHLVGVDADFNEQEIIFGEPEAEPPASP